MIFWRRYRVFDLGFGLRMVGRGCRIQTKGGVFDDQGCSQGG